MISRYHSVVEWIESLAGLKRPAAYGSEAHPKKVRARMKHFMAHLGNPHRGFKIVHVTGTSGKGSTAMMVGKMLQAAGRRTGIYVSPHTTTTIERFHGPDGLLMSPTMFVQLVERIKPVVAQMDTLPEGTPSYLEMMVAIAFLFFKQTRCEWVSLEVGMGGARDATNIIPPPMVAAITPIDVDHAHLIGPSLSNIAREKSGIIKKGTNVFTLERRSALRAIIENQCRRVGARWHPDLIELPASANPAMSGDHQWSNAQLAWTIGNHLGLSNEAMQQGVRATRLPCRFEQVQKNPIVILDGGHNALAIRALRNRLSDIPTSPLLSFSGLTRESRQKNNSRFPIKSGMTKRLTLIVALAETKNAKLILRELPKAKSLILTRFVSSRSSYRPGALLRILKQERLTRNYDTITNDLDADHALNVVLAKSHPKDTIVVCGSLYLTGELRKRWVSEEEILKTRSSL